MTRLSVVVLSALVLYGCSPVQTRTATSRPVGQVSVASIGDVIVRVQVSDDLPNVFGRADLYGRTRDRGFSELRYLGLDGQGNARFRRRDVEIMTNETTLTRTPMHTAVVNAQPAGGGVIVTATGTGTPAATVGVLPPDTVEFSQDIRASDVITIRDQTVRVLEATPSYVRFQLQ